MRKLNSLFRLGYFPVRYVTVITRGYPYDLGDHYILAEPFQAPHPPKLSENPGGGLPLDAEPDSKDEIWACLRLRSLPKWPWNWES